MSTSTIPTMTPEQVVEEGKRRVQARIAELREAAPTPEGDALIEDLEGYVEDFDEITWEEDRDSIELLAVLIGVGLA